MAGLPVERCSIKTTAAVTIKSLLKNIVIKYGSAELGLYVQSHGTQQG